MIRLLISSLRNQKALLSLFCLAIILMLTILPFSLVSFKDVNILISDNISQHARGSYDLLVRPLNIRSELEEKFGVVEENYLDGGKGGISLEQWQQIKELTDVEFAAPVASLGYFTGESKSFSTWMPKQSTRYHLKYYTFDGIKKYPISSENDSIGVMIKQEEIPRITPPFDALSMDYAYFRYMEDPTFLLPATYHLIAAIDPESEAKLTGISFEQLKKENVNPPNDGRYEFAGDAPIIPLLKLSDPAIPLEAELLLEKIEVSEEQTKEWKQEVEIDQNAPLISGNPEKLEPIFRLLVTMPALEQHHFKLKLNKLLQPFEYDAFTFKENLEVEESTNFSGNLGASSKFFHSFPLEYEFKEDDEIFIKQLGEKNGIPQYRQVKMDGATAQESDNIPFVLFPSGEYSVSERTEELSASPLGIYQLAPNKLITDDKGKIVNEAKEVFSTIYPGSFVAAPAHGVIHIEDAYKIKGDFPIDAIRVRIQDITNYDTEAQSKIEEVAKEILEMGLTVDIVAGSSYQEIPVKVEGLGTVMKPYTTLGTAATIVESWSGTTILITFLFSISALVYMANRILFYKEAKSQEMSILFQIGWNERHIKNLFRLELALIFILSWVLSFAAIFIIHYFMEVTSFFDLLIWNIALALITLLFMLIVAEKKLISEKIKTIYKKQKKDQNFRSTNLYLPIQSIKFYKRFLYSASIQITLVSLLSIFIFLAIQETINQSNTTMLGQYINFSISSIHIFILTSSYLLVTVTVIESITTLLIARKKEMEIIKSIGWQFRDIMKVLLSETAIWTAIPVSVGHVIGFAIYFIYYNIGLLSIVLTFLSAVGLFIFIMLISTIVLVKNSKFLF